MDIYIHGWSEMRLIVFEIFHVNSWVKPAMIMFGGHSENDQLTFFPDLFYFGRSGFFYSNQQPDFQITEGGGGGEGWEEKKSGVKFWGSVKFCFIPVDQPDFQMTGGPFSIYGEGISDRFVKL